MQCSLLKRFWEKHVHVLFLKRFFGPMCMFTFLKEIHGPFSTLIFAILFKLARCKNFHVATDSDKINSGIVFEVV